MIEVTTEYFTKLFSSSNPSQMDIDALIGGAKQIVTEQMNEILCDPFSENEIKMPVFDMHPSKAPGPDGFTSIFFQKFWPLIGNDIAKSALAILNSHGDPMELNSTLITLLPKINDPVTLKDFRPIRLCNTCYKIVSRAITNRLRPILNQIIDSF